MASSSSRRNAHCGDRSPAECTRGSCDGNCNDNFTAEVAETQRTPTARALSKAFRSCRSLRLCDLCGKIVVAVPRGFRRSQVAAAPWISCTRGLRHGSLVSSSDYRRRCVGPSGANFPDDELAHAASLRDSLLDRHPVVNSAVQAAHRRFGGRRVERRE